MLGPGENNKDSPAAQQNLKQHGHDGEKYNQHQCIATTIVITTIMKINHMVSLIIVIVTLISSSIIIKTQKEGERERERQRGESPKP